MIKTINLISLIQACHTLSNTAFENFKAYYDLEFRPDEINDLSSFIDQLITCDCSISALNGYVVGYKIPQIGKEFDLLRFGDEQIINIELKKTGDEEKIKKQLIRNKYYLSFAGLQTKHYTYVSDDGSFFQLSDSDELKEIEISELVTLLSSHTSSQNNNFDDFFHPANFLVSPFNSTDRFLASEYFLTLQQEEAACIMVSHITDAKSGFISLTGGAGTGKSLLAYHTARTALEMGGKVLMIHCGILNDGHRELIANGWNITPIRTYMSHKISDYDLIVIDEAQRLRIDQFEYIEKEVSENKKLCLFSYDKQQTLATHEDRLDIESRISSLNPITSHSLSEKIRSNKEIAHFITMLFNKHKNYEMRGGKNIDLKYFSNNEDAGKYLENLDVDKWQLLKFTPSRFNIEHHESYFRNDTPTSHGIIGQEFDNVVVVIDELFSYHESGQLIYRGRSYYHPRKMLFQNITRARKKLLVVIINNEELLERCFEILG